MKIEIGVMVNGVFIKKGSNVKMRRNGAENRNGFYATVTDVDEDRIYFRYKDNKGEWWDGWEDWNNLDFVKLA